MDALDRMDLKKVQWFDLDSYCRTNLLFRRMTHPNCILHSVGTYLFDVAYKVNLLRLHMTKHNFSNIIGKLNDFYNEQIHQPEFLLSYSAHDK